MTLKNREWVTSHIFVKELARSSEKNLKYTIYAYIMISVPNHKNNFMITTSKIFLYGNISIQKDIRYCVIGIRKGRILTINFHFYVQVCKFYRRTYFLFGKKMLDKHNSTEFSTYVQKYLSINFRYKTS